MSVRHRLTIVQFGQFFAWGGWLLTLGAYAITSLGLSGPQVGLLYSLMGFASLLMPGLAGVMADRWVSPERLYAALHLVGGIALLAASVARQDEWLYLAMAVAMFAYMPTIPLGYSISYALLEEAGDDVVTVFPRIRVWGTIGFIAAMWTISLSGSELSARQLLIGGCAEVALAAFALTLPVRPPPGTRDRGNTWRTLGLDSLRFLADRRLAVFYFFAFTLGILLALSLNWVDVFLHDFASEPQFADGLVVRFPAMLISLSQMSEVAFILAIPFFLRRVGIKGVMLISFAAWVVRFGLLAYGDPGSYLWMLVLAMLAYGCAFDFFNIAGSLYVEGQVPIASRASAQGLLMMMINGFGAVVGALIGGNLYAAFQSGAPGAGATTDWPGFWLTCAGAALVLALLFAAAFRAPAQSAQPPRSESDRVGPAPG